MQVAQNRFEQLGLLQASSHAELQAHSVRLRLATLPVPNYCPRIPIELWLGESCFELLPMTTGGFGNRWLLKTIPPTRANSWQLFGATMGLMNAYWIACEVVR